MSSLRRRGVALTSWGWEASASAQMAAPSGMPAASSQWWLASKWWLAPAASPVAARCSTWYLERSVRPACRGEGSAASGAAALLLGRDQLGATQARPGPRSTGGTASSAPLRLAHRKTRAQGPAGPRIGCRQTAQSWQCTHRRCEALRSRPGKSVQSSEGSSIRKKLLWWRLSQ